MLKINNKKLTRAYLETIASQWKRLNVETVDEAMKAAEKEYKKNNKIKETYSKSKTTSEVVPEWFDQNIKKEKISENEEKSLKDMLKEFS